MQFGGSGAESREQDYLYDIGFVDFFSNTYIYLYLAIFGYIWLYGKLNRAVAVQLHTAESAEKKFHFELL